MKQMDGTRPLISSKNRHLAPGSTFFSANRADLFRRSRHIENLLPEKTAHVRRTDLREYVEDGAE
jgi:hypothetical protein